LLCTKYTPYHLYLQRFSLGSFKTIKVTNMRKVDSHLLGLPSVKRRERERERERERKLVRHRIHILEYLHQVHVLFDFYHLLCCMSVYC